MPRSSYTHSISLVSTFCDLHWEPACPQESISITPIYVYIHTSAPWYHIPSIQSDRCGYAYSSSTARRGDCGNELVCGSAVWLGLRAFWRRLEDKKDTYTRQRKEKNQMQQPLVISGPDSFIHTDTDSSSSKLKLLYISDQQQCVSNESCCMYMQIHMIHTPTLLLQETIDAVLCFVIILNTSTDCIFAAIRSTLHDTMLRTYTAVYVCIYV